MGLFINIAYLNMSFHSLYMWLITGFCAVNQILSFLQDPKAKSHERNITGKMRNLVRYRSVFTS